MISTDKKVQSERRGKSCKQIVPVGKAHWHPPAVRRFAFVLETQDFGGTGGDGNMADSHV